MSKCPASPRPECDLIVRDTGIRDAAILALNLRREDLSEVHAVVGESQNITKTLMDGILASTKCKSIQYKGDLVGVFGVSPSPWDPRVGLVWLLCTDKARCVPRAFLRYSEDWIEWMMEDFEVLTNYVDKRNRLHIRWLSRFGFTFLEEDPEYGEGKLPFIHFERWRA